jgi:hypothetical protein
MQLGKHTNDYMVSFYLRTPSGFNVEYGWGAREIDDSTWQVQTHTAGSILGIKAVYSIALRCPLGDVGL